jgi:hypothetical protein
MFVKHIVHEKLWSMSLIIILKLGEGSSGVKMDKPSHCQRFLGIMKEFAEEKIKDPKFQPGRYLTNLCFILIIYL